MDFIEENVVFQYGHMILCMTMPGNTGYSGGSLDINKSSAPEYFKIGSACPNPFNNEIVFPVTIYNPGKIRVSVYDICGNLIAIVFDQFFVAGENKIRWNGTSSFGFPVSSGNYFLQVQNGKNSKTKKIVYLK